jgi:transposase-like protein
MTKMELDFNPKIPKERKRPRHEKERSMYSFGMAGRGIKSHLEKIYNVEAPLNLISRATNAVLEDVREWQNRPLEKSYAVVYLDALRVKGKADGKSCLKSVYLALGVNFEGKKAGGGLKSESDYPNPRVQLCAPL